MTIPSEIMQIHSFKKALEFNDNRVSTKLIMESSFTKEIGIAFRKGQIMKDHEAPFPIVVHVLSGQINFGMEGAIYPLEAGDIITLESHIPHNLVAGEDSIVRLSLSKMDDQKRVENISKS